jgi:hypothetical protein
MGQAKEIRVAPISKKDADALILRLHYSHKVTNNSALALGVFLGGRLEGAMTFGPSMDKSHIQPLVRDQMERLSRIEPAGVLRGAAAQFRKPRALHRDADDPQVLSAH